MDKKTLQETSLAVNQTQIRVRYEETDRMGFVYHGNYFTWFEVGRTELFRSIGLPYTVFEEMGIMLPVTEAESRYRIPAGYDDLITVQTTVTRLTPTRINFKYRLLSPKGTVITEGKTGHAFVDRIGKPINLAKKAPELWERIAKKITG
ncbi:acyl-CoA thioesterase [Phosphitispora fastidiosa]|uniref:acyl-CoA thioesterase n=1 Tax=Phosphitispora fastidiosa TaxID=2837202 RepID=UPI001E3C8FB1|nr:acyl-CoA thioester hydrolase [Phosphitispora fastidiosa]